MDETKKINICGIEYTVNYIESNSRVDTFMGRSDPQKAIITINSTMHKDVLKQTLIHEWLHAVLENYSLNENDNEILIQTIASELFRNGFQIIK